MPVDEREFRAHLARLSPTEATAFVADLWRARGWEVDRTDDRLRVAPTPPTPPETLAVLSDDADGDQPADVDGASNSPTDVDGASNPPTDVDGASNPSTDVDGVVTTTDPETLDLPAEVDVVGPGDVFQLLQFGVEPDRAEQLLDDHFADMPAGAGVATASASSATDEAATRDSAAGDGANVRPADDPDSTAETAVDPASATTERPDDADPAVDEPDSAVDDADLPIEDADPADDAEPADESDRASDSADPGTATASPDRTPSRRTLLLAGGAVAAGFGLAIATGATTNAQPTVEAPGVTAEGVVAPEALGDAHATGIAERSYSLALDLTVSDADERLRSYLSMTLDLAADRTCRTRVATSGEGAPRFLGEPPAAAEFWTDGDTYLVNHAPAETESFTEFQPPDGFVGTWKYWAWMIPFGGTLGSRPRDYFETVFAAVPTRLLDRREHPDGPRYRVGNDGRELAAPSSLNEPGASDVRDVGLDAVVDDRGVVRTFGLDFAAALDGDPVEFSRTVEYSAFDETTVERPRERE